MLLTLSCSADTNSQESAEVFRYNESKGISTLDPAYARNQTILWPVSQLFNGLVQLDDSLHVTPSIAEKWSISGDGMEYRFTIRPDVLFHTHPKFKSARSVVASDFVYSFNRILDPEIASPGSWIFEHVDPEKGFSAPNDTTLVIRLSQPFPPFLSILAMPYCSVVPREIIESADLDFGTNPVGTGPFFLKLWERDEKLVLRRNPNYFELDLKGNRLPYLEAISITFIKDKQSEFLEFLKGNLDFLSGVHPTYKDELLTRSGELNPAYSHRVKLSTMPYLNTEYLGILMEPEANSDTLLLDRRIRQAINYGFDRKKMLKYLRNNLAYAATGGMIPPALSGFMGYGQGYSYDPERALELIGQAGYGADRPLPEITLTTTSDYLDLCEFIQFELERIGFRIKINVSTGAAFRNRVANGDLPLFRGSWIADYSDAENYMALFYSGNLAPAGPNYTRFKSEEFDRYYSDAIRELDPARRALLYGAMDSIVMSEAPVIPLFYDMVVRFVQADVEGFEANPMNNMVLKSVRKIRPN